MFCRHKFSLSVLIDTSFLTFTHSRERSEQVATERGQREKEDSQAKKQQLAERERLRAEQRKRREAVSRVQTSLGADQSEGSL